jgi:polar amino acid transport system substrate-binding protein
MIPSPVFEPTSMDSAAAKTDLLPSGKLRAAINFDNTILASKDPVSGAPGGVSVELAREVARRLGAAFECVPYHAAAKVVEGLQSNAWDICLLAIDPLRAKLISFTAPYVVIEGAYLVTERSPIRDNAEVDRPVCASR